MCAKTRHFFADGNTAQGYIDYYRSNLQGLDRIYILKGGPGTGKSTLIKSVAEFCIDKGLNVDCIHNTLKKDELDGVIAPSLKLAVVDGTLPHVVEPRVPGAVEEYVNLGAAWDSGKLRSHKTEIEGIFKKISQLYEKAEKSFAEALTIHDEWEKYYIKNMDYSKANKLIEETVNLIVGDKRAEKAAVIKDRFFGASTPDGPFDYIGNITSGLSKRYFIKGRPGTGKSTLLKKLVSVSAERGFDVEIYHCAFDAKSLDMVLLPELDLCIFDSTAPHVYEPSKPTDEVIDMYEKCVKRGTDEKYVREIQGVNARYKLTVSRGTEALKEIVKQLDELKKYYVDAMDFDKVNKMRDKIIDEIKTML